MELNKTPALYIGAVPVEVVIYVGAVPEDVALREFPDLSNHVVIDVADAGENPVFNGSTESSHKFIDEIYEGCHTTCVLNGGNL